MQEIKVFDHSVLRGITGLKRLEYTEAAGCDNRGCAVSLLLPVHALLRKFKVMIIEYIDFTGDTRKIDHN